MHVLDAVNAPGKGVGSGDDRYGFDEAAGTAWVIDGATDVGSVRLFPHAESDAAWFADALSARFMSGPRPHEPVRAYIGRVLASVNERVAAEASVDMASAPRDSWPVASFVWMRQVGGVLEFVRLGDCAGLAGQDTRVAALADAARHDDEVRRAGEIAHLSWDEKLPRLRDDRTRYNTPGFCWPDMGQEPAALNRLKVDRIALEAPAGAGVRRGHALLMSDGLYRLVSPFQSLDDEALLRFALDRGLSAALTRLRDLEGAKGGPARYKVSDDACGLLLAVRA